MSRDKFRDTLYETVDIWTETTEIEEYITFLTHLYERIVSHGTYCGIDGILSVHDHKEKMSKPRRQSVFGGLSDLAAVHAGGDGGGGGDATGEPRRRSTNGGRLSIRDLHRRASSHLIQGIPTKRRTSLALLEHITVPTPPKKKRHSTGRAPKQRRTLIERSTSTRGATTRVIHLYFNLRV